MGVGIRGAARQRIGRWVRTFAGGGAAALVAALALAGCVPPATIVPTAVLAAFRPGTDGKPVFRSCAMALGWTREELFMKCGMPDAVTPDATLDGACYVYRTIARTLASDGSQGATYLVACTERVPSKGAAKSVTTQARESRDDVTIVTTTTVTTTPKGKAGDELVERIAKITGTREGPAGP